MAKQMQFPVGHSNTKGFTPQGQKNTRIRDFSGYIVCLLSGETITRPTTTHVHPDRVDKAIQKAHRQGIRLTGPGGIDSDITKPIGPYVAPVVPPPPPLPQPEPLRAGNPGKPIIHVGTGYLYGSTNEAAKAFNISNQLITHCLKGVIKAAKGHVFRYATEDEVKAGKVLT